MCGIYKYQRNDNIKLMASKTQNKRLFFLLVKSYV